MAKTYVPKKKQVKVEKHILPAQSGKLNGKKVTLAYNDVADRYDLRVDGELLISGLYNACLLRASEKGVVWEK